MHKKALLVVSFGTSYEETRKKTIDKIEESLANHFSDYQIHRAFTSQMIINKLKKRDGVHIHNPKEALNELIEQGFEEVLIQPTHIINGSEYEGLYTDILEFKDKFAKIKLGKPLLTSTEDYKTVVHAMSQIFPKYQEDTILLLMGHGSEHHANSAYPCLDYIFKEEGFKHVHIATVEGFPELDTIINKSELASIKKFTLIPLMIVAGDHIQNDLVGDDEDSWKSILLSKGYQVDAIITGMGEIEPIRQMFIEHAKSAMPI